MASFKDMGAYQVTAADIGAYEAETAAAGTNPKGPLHHPLWGPLAGPIFCLIAALLRGWHELSR